MEEKKKKDRWVLGESKEGRDTERTGSGNTYLLDLSWVYKVFLWDTAPKSEPSTFFFFFIFSFSLWQHSIVGMN